MFDRKTADNHYCGHIFISTSLYFELLIIQNKTSSLIDFILGSQKSVVSAVSSQTTTIFNKIPSKESLSASSREFHRADEHVS